MPCDEDRKSTDRNETGSISSSDQKAAQLTGSTVREGPVASSLLTWMIRMSIGFLSTPSQTRVRIVLEPLLASRVGG
jgi:hypothetical protein